MKVLSFLMALVLHVSQGQNYDDTHNVIKHLFNNSRYHTDVVPRWNQSEPIYINASFGLISIVSVDDITQTFTCNGVFTFNWIDEKLVWDPSEYGGQTEIHPSVKLLWRPRVVLINTLGDRDPFGDDESPIIVRHDGFTQWIPGSLFAISCSLSLRKYPFDEQQCIIIMLSMGLRASELTFKAAESILSVYIVNGEWELVAMVVNASMGLNEQTQVSRLEVTVKIKRRPTIYVFNYILPVVFLSLLNMVVFCIPAESGEKIGYSMTVVLAISVFLSQVSEMLPRSSDEVPYVTIYLFALYLVSVLTALVTIFIVFLHHVEEKAVYRQRIIERLKRSVRKLSNVRQAVAPLRETGMSYPNAFHCRDHRDHKAAMSKEKMSTNSLMKVPHRLRVSSTDKHQEDDREFCQEEKPQGNGKNDVTQPNRYKLIGDHIDFISFIVVILIWIIITLWFFISVNI